MRLILLLQIILIIFSQISRIEKLGKKNYTFINFIKDEDGTIFLETSPYYPTNERIFYDLEGFKNKSIDSNFNLSINNTNNKFIGKYDGASSFVKPNKNYDLCLLSISTSGFVELTDFTNETIYYANASKLLGYGNISSFGPILEIYDQYLYLYKYIFSFVVNEGGKTFFMLRQYSFESQYFSANMSSDSFQNGYTLWSSNHQESSKSKMISCFKTNSSITHIMCLYRDSKHRLIITVYDTKLNNSNSTVLNYTGNKEEDDDIFFKGILYKEEIGIFIYYRDYSGTNPIFAIKNYSEVEVEEDLPTNTYNIEAEEKEEEEKEEEEKEKEKEEATDDFYQEELITTIPNAIPTTTPISNIGNITGLRALNSNYGATEPKLAYRMVNYKNFGCVEID